jgi:hypothetical protein
MNASMNASTLVLYDLLTVWEGYKYSSGKNAFFLEHFSHDDAAKYL